MNNLGSVKPSRIKIPKSIEHQVREECGQACVNPNCREWSTASHEIHHIDGNPATSEKSNLVLFCGTCHNKQIAGVISESDVKLWKRMAEAGALPPPKGKAPQAAVMMHDNHGIAAQIVNIETVNLKRDSGKKGRREITPGLIESDPDMRTYADYLVKRYIEWRKKGQTIDGRLFSPRSAHGILGEGFGSSSVLLIPQGRFQDWVLQAQMKIDRTTFGKMNKNRNRRNYHTWEEHLTERHGNA